MPASSTRFLGADSLLALAKCFEEAKNTFLDISREAHQTAVRSLKGRKEMKLDELQWLGDKENGKKKTSWEDDEVRIFSVSMKMWRRRRRRRRRRRQQQQQQQQPPPIASPPQPSPPVPSPLLPPPWRCIEPVATSWKIPEWRIVWRCPPWGLAWPAVRNLPQLTCFRLGGDQISDPVAGGVFE